MDNSLGTLCTVIGDASCMFVYHSSYDLNKTLLKKKWLNSATEWMRRELKNNFQDWSGWTQIVGVWLKKKQKT